MASSSWSALKVSWTLSCWAIVWLSLNPSTDILGLLTTVEVMGGAHLRFLDSSFLERTCAGVMRTVMSVFTPMALVGTTYTWQTPERGTEERGDCYGLNCGKRSRTKLNIPTYLCIQYNFQHFKNQCQLTLQCERIIIMTRYLLEFQLDSNLTSRGRVTEMHYRCFIVSLICAIVPLTSEIGSQKRHF